MKHRLLDLFCGAGGLSSGFEMADFEVAAGIDIDNADYRLRYCKGEYFSVGNNKSGLLRRLVYPVPEPGSGGTRGRAERSARTPAKCRRPAGIARGA